MLGPSFSTKLQFYYHDHQSVVYNKNNEASYPAIGLSGRFAVRSRPFNHRGGPDYFAAMR